MDASSADSAALLGALGPAVAQRLAGVRETPTEDLDNEWSRSGAMALTGWRERPLLAPARVTAGFLRIGRWIASLGGVDVDPLALLAERAALAGFSRGGDVSCGGHTRLLACADGWIAVTLARPDDVAAVPAWLEVPAGAAEWGVVARAVRARAAGELAARARLLGLPAAPLGSVRREDGPAVRARQVAPDRARSAGFAGVVVVDLSSLWAGPLCAHLFQAAGARVVKVETPGRPDGARGSADFFDLLHGGQESVALDFGSRAGRADLQRLLHAADVVIESSRPRALQQLGIDAEDVLRRGRPRLWISITGYGGEGEAANWVAFGDDAAVAGGLVAWDEGRPCFCADAVADPATGLVAAAAAFAVPEGGRWKLDVALARVAAALAPVGTDDWRRAPRGATPPQPRVARYAAPPLGRDTDRVLAEVTAGAGAPRVVAVDA